jgi:hypothetical protein
LKYALPLFLVDRVEPEVYELWLSRKAAAHVKRDRKRARHGVTRAAYKAAIHEAVVRSGGVDAYTGEDLAWHLISQYDNEASRKGRHRYKADFALLPTVDHIDASSSSASFQICAWRTNDAKNDLSVADFLGLCARVLAYASYTVEKRA